MSQLPSIRRPKTMRRRSNSKRLLLEALESRQMMATDMQVRFEFADTSGTPVTALDVGNNYLLNVFVKDVRPSAVGVSQAYFDIAYNSSLLAPSGAIVHTGTQFQAATSGSTATTGLIDEAGGSDTDQVPPPPAVVEQLLLQIPLTAQATGTVNLTGSLADGLNHETLLFGSTTPLTSAEVQFVGGSIAVNNGTILITPTSGLTTTEGGGTASATVVLSRAPTADVSFNLFSSDTSEGTVSPSSFTFTPSNWNIPQTLVITGVDDSIDDDNVLYFIFTDAATSSDPNFNGFNPDNLLVTNIDDEIAGLQVSPTSGLVTSETGSTATFSVVLRTEPTATVTVDLSSSDLTEGTVSPSTLTFTTANWNVPQSVTITGVDDVIDDGDVPYSIEFAPTSSTDPKYQSLSTGSVSVTNQDDPQDVAGFVLSRTSGLVTTELGGTDSFTVRLATQPTANVTVPVSSSNSDEALAFVVQGSNLTTSLVFTPDNWNVPQTIEVTGVDDSIDDGDTAFSVILGTATSADAKYSGLNPSDVTGVNQNNPAEVAGFTVTPTVGLFTSEAGGTATFTIVLNTKPLANVTVPISSGDLSEGTVSSSFVVFAPGDWNIPRTITVTGVDDAIDDDDVSFTVFLGAATSTDPKYNGLNPEDVTVINTDDPNETAAVLVTPTVGLTTSEAGTADTFQIVLATQPLSEVIISLTSSDTTEGTVSPLTITFTPENWNVPQTATVTGVDDFSEDGEVGYTIVTAAAVSDDPKYDGIDPADVSVNNADDVTDKAGITVAPTSGLITTEAGGTAQFTIVLDSQPLQNVTIGLSVDDESEGSLSVNSVLFTPENWNVPQTITVTGVDDLIADGDVAYSVVTAAAVSADTKYQGLNPADVSLINRNDVTEVARLIVAPSSGLVTTENANAATLTVKLGTQPTANVTIAVSSSDTSEGTVNPSSLTFTTSNWNVAQFVTVVGVDDLDNDGDQSYSIVLDSASSDDPQYAALDATNVSASNADNENPGVIVTPTSGLVTSETGQAANFTVVLRTPPSSPVTIPVSSSDPTEGLPAPSSLEFDSTNWNIPQLVVITGVNDFLQDGNVTYQINLGPAVSADGAYQGFVVPSVSITNNDDQDTAGILVSPTSGLVTTESGGTATFTIVLQSQPTADVTIALSSSDTTEGTVTPTSVTFTAANWNVAQTVTVTGVNDVLDDGDVSYTIVTAAAVSTDPQYSGLNAADVSVTNQNVASTPGILVTPTSGLVTTESGGTATFTIVLQSQPTADVTIALSSSDTTEGTVSPTSVTFTAANWSVAQTVTATGVDDLLADGDVTYSIVTAEAVSTDPQYSGLNAADVSVTNQNVASTPGILVTPTSGLVTTESGGIATFTIVLQSQPTADVTIALSSSDTTEGTVSQTSVTFTAANWNNAQTVTVTGVSDLLADGDVAYSIVTAAAVSTDLQYSGLNAADVSVTNQNVASTPGILVTPTSGLVTTESGGTATFTIVLQSQPTADVTIALSSSDTTEGTVSPTSVTFTAANWNNAQTVTVTGVNDVLDDGNVTYTIVTAAAVSTDPQYSGLNAADVSVTNQNVASTPGILVTPTSGLVTTESGGTATFTIVLQSQPTADVTIALSSSDTTEGTVSPTSVTFTAANWNNAQTVTVTGVNDVLDDGNITYTIVTAAAVSTDPQYSGLNAADVSVTNNDTSPNAAIVFGSTSLSVTEGASTSTTVVLTSQPTADVVITFTASVTGQLTLTPSPITFTSSNWNVPQTLTIGTVNDTVVEPSRSISLGAAVTSADSIYQSTTPPALSLQLNDDDLASIAFTAATSQAIEQTGSHTVAVRLTIPGGGSLGESLTVNILDPKTGTAQTPGDYTLSTTSIVFPAGSTTGATQNVSLAIVSDTTIEPNETIQLQLQVPSSGLSGAVSVGTPSTTEITIVDDPSTATLSGAVWIDIDGDQVRDAGEAGVAGVGVTLSGVDVRSRTVQITTLTDATGSYRFTNLPAGTYRITQAQPAALLDGPEVLGTVGGAGSGTIEADSFKDVVLGAGATAVNYNFTEGTLQQTMVTRRLFVASQILGTNYVRNVIATGEQAAGNTAQADVVRQGQSFEVRRIGANVDVTTTGAATNVVFTPAKSQQAADATKHVVQLSGMNFDFPAVDVQNFVFRGNGNVATTRDEITFRDSTANDQLETDGNRAVLSSDDYRAEAIAFELVKAISKSGGTDTRTSISAIDYVLELEGSWT